MQSNVIRIRVGSQGESIRAERLEGERARLLDIPVTDPSNLYDVVRYDPSSEQQGDNGPSYQMVEVVEPSGYRAYLTWGLIHRPKEFQQWRETLEQDKVVVDSAAWINDNVRNLIVAIPPALSALEALTLFNRHSFIVEIISPLLAAHADDLGRAKSDLDRAVAWGGPDAELTYAVAEAFEELKQWDEAMPFWERLAHTLPTLAAARERLAVNYARLGVFPLAATEFEHAANLTEEPEHRRRLEAARDLMWERSRL